MDTPGFLMASHSYKAMVLAAGKGERMRPLTDTTPKPLLMAGSHSLIGWQLQRLALAGFSDIVVNHAHLGQQIEEALGTGADYGVHIHYSPEPEPLETAGGIARALPTLGSRPFLVTNADIYCEYDYGRLVPILDTMSCKDLDAWLVLVDNPEHHPEGDFSLADDRLSLEGKNRFTFSGIGVYRPTFFSGISPGEIVKLAPLLRSAMARGRVGGELFSGTWLDIGTPQRLEDLRSGLNQSREGG